MRNLLLTGGVGHRFAESSSTLAELFRELGVDTTVVEVDNWEGALQDVAQYDVLSFNALRWRMQAERYDHLRAHYFYEATEPLRRAVEQHVGNGRPLFALHTSCICFDDWARWGDILGACWDWDRSFHPVHADVHFRVGDTETTFADEVYHGLRVVDHDLVPWAYGRVDPTATAQNAPPLGAGGVGDEQVVMWGRNEGSARVGVDTMGHDARSLNTASHRKRLVELLSWLIDTGV